MNFFTKYSSDDSEATSNIQRVFHLLSTCRHLKLLNFAKHGYNFRIFKCLDSGRKILKTTTIRPFIPEKISCGLLWSRLTEDAKGTIYMYTSTAYKRRELLV